MLKKVFSILCAVAVIIFTANNSASAADGKIFIRAENCIHCCNCINFIGGKGCLVPSSLQRSEQMTKDSEYPDMRQNYIVYDIDDRYFVIIELRHTIQIVYSKQLKQN